MELQQQTKFTFFCIQNIYSFSFWTNQGYLQKTQINFFQLNYLETQFTQLNPPFSSIKPSQPSQFQLKI